MDVRELPPLRESTEIVAPNGHAFRWADDEPAAERVASDTRHSSTMPGGFESMDTTLPRQREIDYSDLKRLSVIRRYGAGGRLLFEGRLERAPRASGDYLSVSPSAVGYQSALEDNAAATMIFINRDLNVWTGPTKTRIVAALLNFSPNDDPQVRAAPNGAPLLEFSIDGPIGGSAGGQSEGLYDAGPGNKIGKIAFGTTTSNITPGATYLTAMLADDGPDDIASNWDSVVADSDGAAVTYGIVTLTTPRRFLHYQHRFAATSATDVIRRTWFTDWAVIGDHGLTIRGAAGAEGFYASDIVTFIVQRFVPQIAVRPGRSVIASTFVIPQLTFNDATTPGAMIKGATRFGLEDWAVWDGPTFWWHPRGMFSRNWRVRVASGRLEETGPQIDRLWNSVLVQYRDVDGSVRTAGPAGSGADTIDNSLVDADQLNPANELGITRRALLIMDVGTPASAVAVGARFLAESKRLDHSGKATLVGYVEDDRGIRWPSSYVRAGDTLTVIDASDTSARRIVRADHDRPSRACTVDLDAPPEGLQALLERLGVVLAPLGLT